jgi:glyoxylase-like metal-dependent hydrolase (beta-lactamase superfamily II)
MAFTASIQYARAAGWLDKAVSGAQDRGQSALCRDRGSGCFLITTPEGHILINTGLADSVPLIGASVQKLGYKLEDVKILLTMQAHFDHVAGLAEIQKLAGAKVYATEQDAPVLEDGGKSDPFLVSCPSGS